METRGHYSVVRFVPDAFRGEGVNLGVLLLCPDKQYFQWKLTSRHQRAGRFFQEDADAAQLRALGKGLASRLGKERRALMHPDALRDFIGRHQDMLQLTELRTCALTDPDVELERLFARLVEPSEDKPQSTRGMQTSQVRAIATKTFREAGVIHSLEQDVEIAASYHTSPYRFDFGYQNGGPFHLIRATSFALTDQDHGCDRALLLLGEIYDIRQHHKTPQYEFDIIAAFDTQQPDVRDRVSAAFKDNGVGLWMPEQLESLISRIKSEVQ